jgi:redox-sensitive bicupin YhaK (pirin superfamily)
MNATKALLRIHDARPPHWVGDGFPVQNLFDYQAGAADRSPFLLLDYAAPRTFPPTSERLGVGAHPHRGFETVTIVFAGEVEHRDSAGGGGSIGAGDVQWMTAGGGLVHEEFHGRDYARSGGAFEMAQLWVDLPANDKLTAPRYQAITAAQIPSVPLPSGAGDVRVIAGELDAVRGPARTFSPMLVLDVRLRGGEALLPVPAGFTTLLLARRGRVRLERGDELAAVRIAEFARDGSGLRVIAEQPAELLLFAGQPLHQPVVGYGPFVMTSMADVRQAIADFQSGRMGELG